MRVVAPSQVDRVCTRRRQDHCAGPVVDGEVRGRAGGRPRAAGVRGAPAAAHRAVEVVDDEVDRARRGIGDGDGVHLGVGLTDAVGDGQRDVVVAGGGVGVGRLGAAAGRRRAVAEVPRVGGDRALGVAGPAPVEGRGQVVRSTR